MTIRRGIWVAAIAASALATSWAQAQTPDPLAPGAANSIVAPEPGAKPEPADPSAAGDANPAKHHARAKPKAHEAGGSLAVTVDNKRSVGLVELTIAPAGGDAPKKVAGPLAFGRKTVVHLKRAKDCLYDVRGHFADDADTEQLGVDLCKDKVINLTDE